MSYYHAQLPNADKHRVCCSLTHPDVLKIHRQQIRYLEKLLQPKRWFINHDEIRGAGYEPSAQNAGHDPATLLRRHLIQCLKIIKEHGGNKPVVLNSDMYDPFHNAIDAKHPDSFYPMVAGDFTGSWLPITADDLQDAPPITLWNWSFADSEPNVSRQPIRSSLTHFKGLGYPQVLGGFYDVKKNRAKAHIDEYFRLGQRYGGTLTGVCYYTEKRNFDHLKYFTQSADRILGGD